MKIKKAPSSCSALGARTKSREAKQMIGCSIVWIAAIAGIGVMKKIEPHNKLYPPYVILIAILFTLLTFSS